RSTSASSAISSLHSSSRPGPSRSATGRRDDLTAGWTASTAEGGEMPTPIDRDEVQRLRRDEDAQVVEVLPADEFEDEHLPGAINPPLKRLDGDWKESPDRRKPVILYCYDYQ